MPSFLAKILTVVLEKLAQNVVELVQKIDLSWVKIEKKNTGMMFLFVSFHIRLFLTPRKLKLKKKLDILEFFSQN